MILENIIPMIIGALFFLAVASVALVHTILGRHDTRLCIYGFTILTLASSLLTLHWMESSGKIISNQDNTGIFLFICLLLIPSFYLFRPRRQRK